MATLPAEASTLEAYSIMASVTFQYPYAFGASSAEVTIVKLKSSLHQFLLTVQQSIDLLEVLVCSVDLPNELIELFHLLLVLGLLL